MQTFLPHPSFVESARILDWRRLGKQRLEAKQIVNALEAKLAGEKRGWQNHPAVLMWEGHIPALCKYGFIICNEWQKRGYQDTLMDYFLAQSFEGPNPPWVGDERLHASHRARLLQKDPVFYGKFGWTEQPCGPEGYWWPTKEMAKA